jgi:hypothetical protein
MANTIFVPDLYGMGINNSRVFVGRQTQPFDAAQTFVYDGKQLFIPTSRERRH